MSEKLGIRRTSLHHRPVRRQVALDHDHRLARLDWSVQRANHIAIEDLGRLEYLADRAAIDGACIKMQ
ncbi:hypothetical protein D3C86_1676870 [compost metagenome]